MIRKFPLIFLLLSSLSWAQLSIRNNSYVFVNDQVLFVENDVNLEESTAKLYLRNESQLIQGSGVTGNSGLGELSVYQEGTANQWAYNYWCSPVGGTLTDNNSNNVLRFDNQLDDPLLGTGNLIDSNNALFTTADEGTASPLVIANRWLYSYTIATSYSNWTALDETSDLSAGLGFTMKGTGTGLTGSTAYDFRGKPNNGTITNTVAADQWTLVGNPYPSAIDAAAFIHDTDNVAAIEDTIYYWEQDGSVQSHVLQSYIGGYASYTINAAGDTETFTPAVFQTYDELDNSFPLPIPQNGSKVAQRYIPIGQGFMVEGITGTSGTVSMKNAFRAYVKEGGTSYFFRDNDEFEIRPDSDITSENTTDIAENSIQYQQNGLSIVPDDYKRFRINIDFTVNTNQYTRQVVLNFHDSATFGHDRGLELFKGTEFNSDGYFTYNNKDYVGQAFPFDQALVIPMTLDIEAQQPIRFRIFDIQNFDSDQGIYIHDTDNNTYANLRTQDYEINVAPGSYTDRFEIVFVAGESLGIDETLAESLIINQNNDLQQLAVINRNNLDVKTIEVFDIAGKSIIKSNYDTILDRYKLSTNQLSDGAYVVNVVSNKGITSQKILVKN